MKVGLKAGSQGERFYPMPVIVHRRSFCSIMSMALTLLVAVLDQSTVPGYAQSSGRLADDGKGWTYFPNMGKINDVTVVRSTGSVHIKVKPTQNVRFLFKNELAVSGRGQIGSSPSVLCCSIPGDQTLTMRFRGAPRFERATPARPYIGRFLKVPMQICAYMPRL